MPRRPPLFTPEQTDASSDPLVERIRGRVRLATQWIVRREGTQAATSRGKDFGPELQARALRVVYCTMARAYRLHREQTGQGVPPALKQAARVFRQEPSLQALVPVAGHLDALGLLKW